MTNLTCVFFFKFLTVQAIVAPFFYFATRREAHIQINRSAILGYCT